MNKQLALAIQLNEAATLKDFNWSSNLVLHEQLKDILTRSAHEQLFIWGPSGSGKSHLLQACCQATDSNTSSIYLPLRLLKDLGPEILEGMEEQRLIGIDDIDAIAGIHDWEEALFHLYNKIRDNQNSILIITSSKPPTQNDILLPDLGSRLSWGLVFQLHELLETEKINTLKKIAENRGFTIPETVCQFLINRCSRNMHDLTQLIYNLDEASLRAHRKITIPFVKEVLQL